MRTSRFSRGCPEISRMPILRDRLRRDADDRGLYARTKVKLARKVWKYGQNSADARRASSGRSSHGPAWTRRHRMNHREDVMQIIEKRVSAGDRPIFDLDEFLSRPLYAHLAHASEEGPRESPVWFHWDGAALWIIGGTSFPANLRREPRCAIGIVDWDPASGLSQHVGLRGRAEVLPFDTAVARTIFRKYFGPDEELWDPRFREDVEGETGVPLIRFTPETVVMRDQSYKSPSGRGRGIESSGSPGAFAG